MLNSLIMAPGGDQYDAEQDWKYGDTAEEMMNAVLADEDILPQKKRKNLQWHSKGDKKKRFRKGQLNTKKSGIHKLGITSGYGEKNASEFFAEAFADVYAHGRNARPASIRLVKEYEKRRHLIPKEQVEPADIEGLDAIPDDMPGDGLLNTSMIAHSDLSRKKPGGKKKK